MPFDKRAIVLFICSTAAQYHLDSRDCYRSARDAQDFTQAVTMIVLAALSVPAGTPARIALMYMCLSCAADVAFLTTCCSHARAPDVIVGTLKMIAIPFVALWKCDQV